MTAQSKQTPIPESSTLATVQKTGAGREPWELQDRLGRNKLIEWVLKYRSGRMANTTLEFQNYNALQVGVTRLGYANHAERAVLNDKADNSGDAQGKNKLQAVQLLEEKNILVPGGAGLYKAEEPPTGLIAKIKGLFGWG
jgi:hypothetical protein